MQTINQAFHVQMRRYRVSISTGGATTNRIKRSYSSVTASIGSDILAVTGLNSTQPQANDTTSGTGAATKARSCSR